MNKNAHIFFLGIGGIGMSALARYMNLSGAKVSGYDRDKTELTKKLEAEGMKVQYDFNESILDLPIDIVVYTPAIKSDQREFVYFKNAGTKMLKRSEMLQDILGNKRVIAIAGTHGKTTTSAFLAHILEDNDFDASAFVGGIIKNYNSNFIFGKSDWVIIEADEYDRSFLRLNPEIALIQAIDADHLDIYQNEVSMVDAYRLFTTKIIQGGSLFLESRVIDYRMTKAWKSELMMKGITIQSFGINSGKMQASDIKMHNGVSEFSVSKIDFCGSLYVPGEHNIRNALGAISIAHKLGISIEGIEKSISSFKGIARRFEYVFRNEEVIVIDDYAHHPKEIDAAILAAKENHPAKELTVVFQPHLYSRTRDFMDEFAKSLECADEIILVELYPAREFPIDGVNSKKLLSIIESENKNFVKKNELATYLGNKKRPLILLLGAGDVYKHIEEIKSVLSA